jgi:hypothetical protein
VLLGQRNVQPVISGRGLQLKIESHGRSACAAKSPGLVDAAAKRRVDDQLHPAAFIEKPLRNDGLLRRHRAQHGASLQNVFNRLLRARIVEPAFFFQPRNH